MSAALAAGLLLAAAATPAASAGFKASYRAGLDALEQGDSEAAVRLLREATDDNPEAAAHHPRLFFRRYTPYFHLGEALAAEGECRAALAAWNESERQGVILELPQELETIRRGRQRCEERFAREELESLRGEAAGAVARARGAARALEPLRDLPELTEVWEWRDDSLADRAGSALGMLDRAGELVEEGVGRAELDEARGLASRAYWQLEAVRAEASRHLEEVRRLLERQRRSLAELSSRAGDLLAGTRDLAADAPLLARRRDELARLLERPQPTDSGGLAARQDELAAAIEALRGAAAPPPPALRRAAEALFAGGYVEAIGHLDEPALRSTRSRAHAHLLRAAARFALARSAPAGADLLDAAATAAAEARRLDAGLEPEPGWFSPAFVEFFAAATAEPGASGPPPVPLPHSPEQKSSGR